MSEHDPFIRAVTHDPASEIPRLVYADWLDEHGDPDAADYLRTELELAKLALDSPAAPALRTRLWQTWATVDPRWLMTFTQPRMLLANPTPFPATWTNFGLGKLRPRQGTYGRSAYDSLPTLQLDEMRGEFPYFGPPPENNREEHSRTFERMMKVAAELGVHLPAAFVRLMRDRVPQYAVQSPTDCFFDLPREETRVRFDPSGSECVHVHFYCDSQSCVLWDLYVHRSGGHCVIARSLDYFAPDPGDPDDDRPPYTGPRAWFVAPSFEAFVYRVWLENQIFFIEHADFFRDEGRTLPPMSPAIQAYMDHYRNQQASTPSDA